MRLLLTNDDGIDAAGLVALREELSGDHEVWVVAPESNRSGTSHSVTLHEASRLQRRGERSFAASGSPADCVLVAHLGVVPVPIDLVLSGVNHGPNLGTDIVYSGTAAAARQASLSGIPGVALSLCRYDPPLEFGRVARFVRENLESLRSLWSRGSFLNVNFPADGDGYRGVRLTVPCVRSYRDRLHTFESPRGDLYCFLGGARPEAHPEEATDYAAIGEGMVSISILESEPGRAAGSGPALDGFRLPA